MIGQEVRIHLLEQIVPRDLVVGGTIRKIHNILRTPYDEPNIDSNSYIFPIDKEILLNNITQHLHIAHIV